MMCALMASHPVVALIPGPARGYVKRGLLAAGVPFFSTPFVPIETFSRYYHACDVYVMTGREEGGPASVLESLASATPLVAHRTGMAPDLIEDGVSGFLADVGDVEGLADRVRRVVDTPALADRFREAGRRTAERYAWPIVAREYARLYASVRSS